MAKVVLYGLPLSPPVRSVVLTLKALDVPYEFKIVDFTKGEQLTEEFLKHNPQHTVPVLDDNGTWIWDSHAICAYLVGKYGKNDELYPKDLAKRAIVDQRMYFNASVLFMSLRSVSAAYFRNNVTVVMREKSQNIIEGYDFLEKFIGGNPFVTGDTLTIADFCCLATATTSKGIIDIDPAKYPNITSWINRLSKLPYYQEANGKGSEMAIAMLKGCLTQVIV